MTTLPVSQSDVIVDSLTPKATISLQNTASMKRTADHQTSEANAQTGFGTSNNDNDNDKGRRRKRRNKNRRDDKSRATVDDNDNSSSSNNNVYAGNEECKPYRHNQFKNINSNNRKKNKRKENGPESNDKGNESTQYNNNSNSKKGQRWKKNKRKQKRYPWRRYIPKGSDDPITLEPLESLPYPPFAIVATEPYIPIEEWPVQKVVQVQKQKVEDNQNKDILKSHINNEERQRHITQEQWGELFPMKNTKEMEHQGLKLPPSCREDKEKERHYHLFDGKALACYLVSQLQFIDPLNRRDLTRDELINLDRYLERHGFNNIKVVDAYDAKGVSISMAGAAGHTAAGQMEILQQEARVLLDSLFGNNCSRQPNVTEAMTVATPSPQRNPLQDQYAAYMEASHIDNQTTHFMPNGMSETVTTEDPGIYSDLQGLVLIDDDINPGLRGSMLSFTQKAKGTEGPMPITSASHIVGQHSDGANNKEFDFPALSNTTASTESKQSSTQGRQRRPSQKSSLASNTLKLITKAIKKTTREETQRQQAAREEARRCSVYNYVSGTSAGVHGPPSDAQLQRNCPFAEALNVTPSTIRVDLNSGWARPNQSKAILNKSHNESNTNMYPETIIIQARERMAQLPQLERIWTFRQSQVKIEERQRRKRQEKELKLRALESAFASSDEEESDWEEAEELFCGGDDE